jgi:hypothetical protein
MIRAALYPASRRFASRAIAIVGVVLVAAAPQQCPANGGGHAAPSHGGASDADADLESPTGFRGIGLGEYNIRTYRSVSGQKNRVRFTLHATVKNEHAKSFQQMLQSRINKVRDQVIVATRLVPVEDYDDPELTKLRRRIQLRLRRTLPELIIEDIYVSEFTLSVESS